MLRFSLRVLVFSGLVYGLFEISFLRSYRTAIFNLDPPQLILVLGGDVDREHVGVRLANELKLPLVVSGGSNPEHADWLIRSAGLPPELVKFDYRAKDTLGNFTSLVDEFLIEGISHVLLITSEDHLSRAMLVGWMVAGSRGIHLTGLSVPCNSLCIEEKWQKKAFDLVRSFVWILTGKDMKALLTLKWPQLFSTA